VLAFIFFEVLVQDARIIPESLQIGKVRSRRLNKAKKKRLDVLLVELGLAPTREKSRRLIMAGQVCVDGVVSDKPGRQVSTGVTVTASGRATNPLTTYSRKACMGR